MTDFLPSLHAYLQELEQEAQIPFPLRRQRLKELVGFIHVQLQAEQPASVIFICTHNSRRSHFCQVWAQVWANYYGLDLVKTYSGGVEVTAAHPNTLEALHGAGFGGRLDQAGNNPRQELIYAKGGEALRLWSKLYNDPSCPDQGFAAVMTCSEADEACPLVSGMAARIALPYEDPKKSDGTPQQAETYAERCRQIAGEMGYVMREVNKRLS